MRPVNAATAAALCWRSGSAEPVRRAWKALAQTIIYPQIIDTRWAASQMRAIHHLAKRATIGALRGSAGPPNMLCDTYHTIARSLITAVTEVTLITSDTPEFDHITGNARFKVIGMAVASSTVPRPRL